MIVYAVGAGMWTSGVICVMYPVGFMLRGRPALYEGLVLGSLGLVTVELYVRCRVGWFECASGLHLYGLCVRWIVFVWGALGCMCACG